MNWFLSWQWISKFCKLFHSRLYLAKVYWCCPKWWLIDTATLSGGSSDCRSSITDHSKFQLNLNGTLLESFWKLLWISYKVLPKTYWKKAVHLIIVLIVSVYFIFSFFQALFLRPAQFEDEWSPPIYPGNQKQLDVWPAKVVWLGSSSWHCDAPNTFQVSGEVSW